MFPPTQPEESGNPRARFVDVSMRQLFPAPSTGDDASGALDLTAAYLPDTQRWLDQRPPGSPLRPWTTVNMVASVDGSMTLDGRSGGMSDEGDRRIFSVLRSMADVIMVGAGTARTERYGPARIPAELLELRVERGQSPIPQIAVVSASGQFDPELPMFDPEVAGDGPPPLIITCTKGEANVQRLALPAETMVAGDNDVDLGHAMTMLAQRGAAIVVSEGGPTLNADMVDQGLLDELCLTISPLAVGGAAGRIIAGTTELSSPVPMELAHVLEMGSVLYTRWRFNHSTR